MQSVFSSWASQAESFIREFRAVINKDDLTSLMEAVAHEMGFRYFALAHHDDPSADHSDRVQILHYPPAITERLQQRANHRRDPVVRGCVFADGAFIWSELNRIITLDRFDQESFERGAREGLNEGITTPFIRLGDAVGSCTFAGMRRPEIASRYLGPCQMLGIFAFQAARRLVVGASAPLPRTRRLHPRPRDCVVLVGRGYSNKEIARAMSITPRTVDGYLTAARKLFDAHDRTELVFSAVLAGEIGLDELKRCQPE